MNGGRRALYLVMILSTYGVALAMPAIGEKGGGEPIKGLEALQMGWQVPVPWAANVFLLLGLFALMARVDQAALVLAGIAFTLGLTTPVFLARGFTMSSTGLEANFQLLRIGFYLWMLCFVLLALASMWEMREQYVEERDRLRGAN